jgi:hypothetical protein
MMLKKHKLIKKAKEFQLSDNLGNLKMDFQWLILKCYSKIPKHLKNVFEAYYIKF